MRIPDHEELPALAQAAGDDPDRLSRLYNYIRLLKELDEQIAGGQEPAKLYSMRARIAVARREL